MSTIWFVAAPLIGIHLTTHLMDLIHTIHDMLEIITAKIKNYSQVYLHLMLHTGWVEAFIQQRQSKKSYIEERRVSVHFGCF